MAIRFKKEPDTEQQQFDKWLNKSQYASTDRQEFLNPRSKRSPVFRHNQLSQVLTNFQVNHSHRWQGWVRRWDNFDFRTKLAIVLVGTSAISATIATQGVVTIASHRLSEQIQGSLQSDISLLEQKLELQMREDQTIATGVAEAIEATGLDLTKKTDIKFGRELLKDFDHPKEAEQSFRFIVDARGQTIAHSVEILQSDFVDSPPLPSLVKPEKPKYRPVSLHDGIKLGDMPIVKDALQSEHSLSGTEIFGSEVIERLGLEKQANIGFHFQETQGLSNQEKPYLENKYDLASSLVRIVVQPIKNEGKVIGAVIVGTLLNQNYQIVDSVSKSTGVKTSLFSYDSQVSTNVPDPNNDNKSRAIGTRASTEVVDAVLKHGQKFSGKSNLVGDNYFSIYTPLYDHSHKPVGISFVGRQDTEVQSLLNKLLLVSYCIGGGAIVLAGFAALGFSSRLARPVRRLANFAQQVRDGDQEAQLDWTWRQDEIGVLTRRLNWMSELLWSNESRLRDQERLQQESAETTQLFASVPLRIRASLNLEDILQTAVQEVLVALKTDRVLIYCLDSNSNWSGAIVAQAVAHGKSEALGIHVKTDLVQSSYKTYSVFMDEVIHRPSLLEYEIQTEQASFLADMVGPIIVNDQLYGLLISQDHSDQERPKLEIDLFKHLATQTGIMLEQSNLLEQVEQVRIESERKQIEQSEYKESLQRQLVNLLSDFEGATNGDLTVHAEVTADELGTVADIFNSILANLRYLVSQVAETAVQVNSSVCENDGFIHQISEQIFTQSSDIANALNSIEQMARSLQAVTDSATELTVVAQTACSTAEAGREKIDRAAQSSLILRSSVTETANNVNRLSQSSEQIGKALFSLNQIAQQTNVLAINASIEAARAGEAGRGFGVVAEGVSKLSAQAAITTREIEQIVGNIQRETSAVAKSTELSTTQVSEAGYLIESANKSLVLVLELCRQIEHLAQSSSTATGTQTQVADLIYHLMKKIDSESEISSVHQLANSLGKSVAIAHQLQTKVGVFKLDSRN